MDILFPYRLELSFRAESANHAKRVVEAIREILENALEEDEKFVVLREFPSANLVCEMQESGWR